MAGLKTRSCHHCMRYSTVQGPADCRPDTNVSIVHRCRDKYLAPVCLRNFVRCACRRSRRMVVAELVLLELVAEPELPSVELYASLY